LQNTEVQSPRNLPRISWTESGQSVYVEVLQLKLCGVCQFHGFYRKDLIQTRAEMRKWKGRIIPLAGETSGWSRTGRRPKTLYSKPRATSPREYTNNAKENLYQIDWEQSLA